MSTSPAPSMLQRWLGMFPLITLFTALAIFNQDILQLRNVYTAMTGDLPGITQFAIHFAQGFQSYYAFIMPGIFVVLFMHLSWACKTRQRLFWCNLSYLFIHFMLSLTIGLGIAYPIIYQIPSRINY